MLLRRLMQCLGICCVAVVTSATAVLAGEQRAVIELFTSQGCSSCPAADLLLGELSRDPTLVPLSLAVNYWDYLGWKDTLSLPSNTQRQRGYAKSRGDRQVYTPQAVVNGVVHVVGSDRAAIDRAIAQSRGDPSTMAVTVTLSDADGVTQTIRLP